MVTILRIVGDEQINYSVHDVGTEVPLFTERKLVNKTYLNRRGDEEDGGYALMIIQSFWGERATEAVWGE